MFESILSEKRLGLIGATEQNLLKLFERIIDDPALGIPILAKPQPYNEKIIY